MFHFTLDKMFNLTKGILKQIQSKQFITEQNVYDTDLSKIRLRNYESPIIVVLTKINFFKECSFILLNLFDGEDNLECLLEKRFWHFLNKLDFTIFFGKENLDPINDQKLLKIGSVLIISEYSFIDVLIKNEEKRDDLMVLLNFSVVGFDETYNNVITFNSDKQLANKQFSIVNLSPSLNNVDWYIKAKLLKISLVKEFKNKINGEDGQYIRLQFTDESGLVELVAFNLQIEKVKNLCENRVYKIINADVKICKTNYQAFQVQYLLKKLKSDQTFLHVS